MKRLLRLLPLLALVFCFNAIAHERPKPVATIQTQEPTDHWKENTWGGAGCGGLAITGLQKLEHPWLYAVGGCAALAAAVEGGQPGGFNSKNFSVVPPEVLS